MATISDGSPEGAFPARFSSKSRVAVMMGGTSGLGRAITRGVANWGADGVATGQDEESACETGGERECGAGTIRHTVTRTPMHRFGRPEVPVGAAVLMASGVNS